MKCNARVDILRSKMDPPRAWHWLTFSGIQFVTHKDRRSMQLQGISAALTRVLAKMRAAPRGDNGNQGHCDIGEN